MKFLNLLGTLSGHTGKRLDLFRRRCRLLRDVHELFLGFYDGSRDRPKTTDCCRRSGVDAVEGVQRLAGALWNLNAEFIRRAADCVAKTDRFALAIGKSFLEVGKNALRARTFLFRLCDGVLDLLHRLLELCPVRAGFLKRVVILLQLGVHLVQLGFGVVDARLPRHGALICHTVFLG